MQLMMSVIYWDPNPAIFTVPYLNFPIFWYGVCFALGFWISFPVFVGVLSRYFRYTQIDSKVDFWTGSKRRKSILEKGASIQQYNPLFNNRFSAAFNPAQKPTFESIWVYTPGEKSSNFLPIKQKAQSITDRLTVFVVIGTILGARLGHFLFYERPADYLNDPLEFFRFRSGGLASHGAVMGIIFSVLFFSYRIKKKYPDLNWVRLLDFLSVPAPLAGACIRIGNFFNQEILGIPTTVSWAVFFGHPADGSEPGLHHPAQLYEAFCYLALFFFFWRLSHKPAFLLAQGRLIGLLLVFVFFFRFCIEFLKSEQSHLLSSYYLTMGQILSVPIILAGFVFYNYKRLSIRRD
ncbi:MAG TPA: prolipoprotein diacylglyceryl transferase [Chlamydiales bacterium]|nr:prolipoprotein diacylglyceryl transferase [Chlamydiales bacterium]